MWGVSLPDDRFACALAALGVLDAQPAVFLTDYVTVLQRVVGTRGEEPVAFAVGERIQKIIVGDWSALPSPAALADAWDNATRWKYPPLRIAVRLAEAFVLDPVWVVEQLSRPAVGAQSVFIDLGSSEVQLSWEWPLRIGYLPDQKSIELVGSLANLKRRHLFKLVDVGQGRPCDLLILPSSVSNAASRLIAHPGKVRSDCVLVLGGAKEGWEDTRRYLDAIRGEVTSGGITIGSVPKEMRREWFDKFIVQLSHDEPIDVAFTHVARDLSIKSPLPVLSTDLARYGHLDSYTQRLGKSLTRSAARKITLSRDVAAKLQIPEAASAEEIGKALTTNAMPYVQESGDATLVVEARREVEEQMGPVPVAPAGEPEPMMAEMPVPPRHVQAAFFRGEVLDEPNRVTEVLQPGTSYTIAVKIAAKGRGWATLPEVFPQEKLQASPTGHTLTVVLFEYPDDPEAAMPKPQVDTIHLPPAGDSGIARFFTMVPSTRSRYKARIAILHRNRVLQTMKLYARVEQLEQLGRQMAVLDVDEPPPIGLYELEGAEARVAFSDLDRRRDFGAALILNRTDSGLDIVHGVSGKTAVAFVAPQDLRDAVEMAAQILKKLETREEQPTEQDELLRTTLRDLAKHGRKNLNTANRATDGQFAKFAAGGSLQVVEAHVGSFLPVELFYGRPAPDHNARICEHGLAALATGAIASPCPNPDAEVICPVAFWGFSRVIERQPHRRLQNADFEIDVSTEAKSRPRLDFLSSALIGVSENVMQPDRDAVVAAVKAAVGKADEATSWKIWKSLVAKNSPTLFVLLPHSQNDPVTPGLAAIEISGDPLPSSSLEPELVCGPDAKCGPMVLLLGCNTGLTEIGFQNFVSGFGFNASVVLGTLSKILGRHAGRFVKRLLAELKSAAAEPDATFGDALLRIKQTMLAEGDPFALTLIAYGDAEWRI